jgi:hypothetical protein
MKTSNEKRAPRKSLIEKKILTKTETTVKNDLPGEEEIREKAEEIYYQRMERGEYGTAEEDWFNAVEYLRVTEK